MTERAEVAARRTAFNEFYEGTIVPLLGLSREELDSLADEEIAMRIDDLALRRKYCQLGIEMLDASIKHHAADARSLEPAERDGVTPVVSTLVVAAVVSYQWSISAALLAAAGCYWLAHDTSRRRHAERVRQVREHNEMAPEWKETIAEWEQGKAALREVLHEMPEIRT